MLIVPITQREFNLYALSLPRGPNFDALVFHSAWKAGAGISIAAILQNEMDRFDTLVMRRQTDQGLDVGCAAVDVDCRRRESEHFRDSAAAPAQHKTKQARFRLSAVRRLDETPALGGVEIFSAAGRPVKAHPGVGMVAHRCLA
jgi:hypothetical protein